MVDLARKTLIGKAMQRPDHVRRVLQKIKAEGLLATATQVRAKLNEPMPLGYSAAGVVLECGRGVQEFKPGDRIAMAAPHAGVVSVGRNLCVGIPDALSFDRAAYASIAAIALEGVRLARVGIGDRVLVIGLGLIGQMTVALLRANGCRVFGTDVDPAKLHLAVQMGAERVGMASPSADVLAFSDSIGVDAVIIAAATSSNTPIEFAAEVCRQKGRIVLVGVVGLQIPRPPFFAKELEFTVSGSSGPGRGDPAYEEKGIDYPAGHVRWTAQRNMQAVIELMADGKLPVEKLTTHEFDIDAAAEAYELITSGKEPFLGVLLRYPEVSRPLRRVEIAKSRALTNGMRVGLIGVGNFARLVIVPTTAKDKSLIWRGVCSAKGMNAEQIARDVGAAYACTDAADVINDAETDAVLVATRHDLHASLVMSALRAGKAVFVEKPLCITRSELNGIAECVTELGADCPVLSVGFNRRFAPATIQTAKFFENVRPLSIAYRFSAGYLPRSTWPQDEDFGGGRIIGEASHAIDTCIALTGSVPGEVYAQSAGHVRGVETTDDRVFITMRHDDGSVSSVSYQAGGDRAVPPERLEVFGGGKTAIIDNWSSIDFWAGNRHSRVDGGKDKGYAAEFSGFFAACRSGLWPIPWEQIYGTAWASLMAVQSLREGIPVRLADAGEAD
ncbi:MAG: bi-domain-containing oxidoreductase [Thermoanaerobaculia bacterium]